MSYGLKMKEYTLSGRQANLYGLLFIIPVLLVDTVPYLLIWCERGRGWAEGWLSLIHRNMPIIQQVVDAPLWLLLLPMAFLAGIVLHVLMHGIVMAAFAKNGWKSVSFGFNVQAFAPYTHCNEPLSPNAYRLTLVMPGILLGDVPVLISWFTGNILFLFFGILFTLCAAGNIIIVWLSRNITDGKLQDHPEKIGFVHIEKDE